MEQKSESELKKLAFPALRYAELVELARQLTPNKAQEVASGRWPRRQARACRFLAILYRDYPKSFEEFVASSEHVRPDDPVPSTLEEKE